MHHTTEILAAVALGVVGISHLAHPRAWVDFFVRLRSAGDAGILAVAILHFWPGVLIVAAHNVWSGIAMILTIIGWGWMTKASLYLMFPAIGRWAISRVSIERAHEFRVAGVVLIMLAGLIGWAVIRT